MLNTITNNGHGGTTSTTADDSTVAVPARPAVYEAKPRPNNTCGHIVRRNETGSDGDTASTFDWDIPVRAGQPIGTDARAPSARITPENLL